MKLKLNKGNIEIVPMKIPENTNNMYLEYVYELNTNHLQVELIIMQENKVLQTYIGDRKYVTVPNNISGSVMFKVLLKDSNGTVIKTYTKHKVPVRNYVSFGNFINLDIEMYISKLQERIRELEEKGDVV